MELCQCNNCERVLIDENPQINATQHDISNIKVYSMQWIEEEEFWACPHCLTDAYLQDL